ncbi:MAG: helix-turn-helix domain-containing protein [Planctomycetaceae bacterium]|nr:helix-turn-helix domain-containing protein [Planctomycetaceae bacterium]
MSNASTLPAALRRPATTPLSEKAGWSLSDTAAAATLSPRSIQRAVKAGELPVARVGRRLLFSPQAVRDWITDRQSTAAE